MNSPLTLRRVHAAISAMWVQVVGYPGVMGMGHGADLCGTRDTPPGMLQWSYSGSYSGLTVGYSGPYSGLQWPYSGVTVG